MKFCPKCEVKLKRADSGLCCPKCGHSEAEEEARQPKKSEDDGPGGLNVFEGSEGDELKSTIKKECEKCGNNEAVWWMLQTRSADEPTTQFYRCTKCSYTWRDYA